MSLKYSLLPRDVMGVSSAFVNVGGGLLVIDPLMAYLEGSVNSWRDQDVRAALAPLAEMAQSDTYFAALILRHLNKSSGGNALSRGGGSIGIIGAARSGLLVAKDPDDPEHCRMLAGTKSNLGPPLPALRYRIQPTEDDPYSQRVRVEWLGASTHTADSPLREAAANAEADPSATDDAADFLRAALAAGPRPVKEIERAANAEGISLRTLDRARRLLRLRKTRQGFGQGGRWLLALPDDGTTGDDGTEGNDGLAGAEDP